MLCYLLVLKSGRASEGALVVRVLRGFILSESQSLMTLRRRPCLWEAVKSRRYQLLIEYVVSELQIQAPNEDYTKERQGKRKGEVEVR